ncbi:hypothetical protein P261_02647 [Lachnospiraceae bacterium TWA4]|nr:hypothetical protein P261_02647 [Lachnospiraceae bacterium TWA4]
MERKDVESILGVGNYFSHEKNRVYYFNDEMRIDYGLDETVEFIEFLYGIDGELQPILNGKEIFQMDANQLFDMLSDINNGEIDDSEGPFAYAFLEISVGVYRESTPEDIEDLRAKSEEDGNPMSQEEFEEEMRRANHWMTFGIGVKDYYRF